MVEITASSGNKSLPSDYEAQYREWRSSVVQQDTQTTETTQQNQQTQSQQSQGQVQQQYDPSVDRGTVGDDGFFTSLTEEEAYINIDNPYDGYGEVSIGYGKNIGTSGNSGGVNKYTPGGIMIIEED